MFYKPSFNKQLYEAEPELLKTGGSSFADTVEASPGERVCDNFYSIYRCFLFDLYRDSHVKGLKREREGAQRLVIPRDTEETLFSFSGWLQAPKR